MKLFQTVVFVRLIQVLSVMYLLNGCDDLKEKVYPNVSTIEIPANVVIFGSNDALKINI